MSLAQDATRPDPVVNAFATSGLLAPGVVGLATARLRGRDGTQLPWAPQRWHDAPSPEEADVLDGLPGPVIDVACGPGRLVRHLVEAGTEALGVDVAPDAVAAAVERGAPALLADLWDPLPMEGGWATVLLFDGNVGIGGDPVDLLVRCGELLAPSGTVVVELGPRGSGSGPIEARIEWGVRISPWFPWALVGIDELGWLARESGLAVVGVAGSGDRRFARLTSPTSG